MATIDYKEKYEAALERCKKLYNEAKANEYTSDIEDYETIFPELKESEDERIRKDIISAIKEDWPGHEDWIAWLESKGEKSIVKSYEWDDEKKYCYPSCVISKQESEDEKIRKALISFLKSPFVNEYITDEKVNPWVIWLEKHGEQKPVDTVEPKFKVGEWITNSIETVQITGYDIDYGYQVDYKGKLQHRDTDIIEKEYHLWTIQDAKDGDVLVASDGSIFLFKGTIDGACRHYIALTTDHAVKLNKGLTHYWETSRAVHPATQEQRDLLFSKMKEAGYEWDAEKKELKKIKQKSIPMSLDEAIEHCKEKSCGNNACALEHKQLGNWLTELKELKEQKPAWSEEDDNAFGDALWCCKQAASIAKDENDMGNIWYAENWLKSLKDRVQPKFSWSEEDRRMLTGLIDELDAIMNKATPNEISVYSKYTNWLKSLRPQTKKEWDKADKEYRDAAIYYLRSYCNHYKVEPILEWLEELEPQSHWKPSEGQLECLGYAIEKAEKDWSPLTNNRIYLTLKALKEQLLELRGSKV